MNKLFIDNLPKWESGTNKGKVNWSESVGYKMKFIYRNLNGELMITNYEYPHIWIKYKNYSPFKMHISAVKKCGIKGAIVYDLHYKNENKWVDLSSLPLLGSEIDWEKSINKNVEFKYNEIKGSVTIINYSKEDYKLKLRYSDNRVWDIGISSFIQCGIGRLLGEVTSDFKIEIGTTFKDSKRDITIIDRKYIKSKRGENCKSYRYKCNKCGFDCGKHYKNGEYKEEHWIVEGNLFKSGCAICNTTSHLVVPHINSIVAKEENMWMAKYFQGGYDEAKRYTPNSGKKIYFKCPDCGRIKSNLTNICNLNKTHSINCSCQDGFSYSEKLAFSLLQQLNIKFETQYSPKWIKPKRYDFYFKLNNKKFIVETDGGWHYKDNKMSGKTKEETKAIDDYKDKLAEEHNIKVIRINCEISELKYIKDNILNSELNNIFDLSKVNWLKCGEFALGNLAKKACEIKRDNPNITTKEIGIMMNLSTTTIVNYLNKGTKIWDWITYNGKEEKLKASRKMKVGKVVEILKDDISLGVFPSIRDLVNKSEKLFGIKMDNRGIRDVCNKQRLEYKGFVFRYTKT